MSGSFWCDACEGMTSEFCAGPCDDCGRALHCNHSGRCESCQDDLDEAAWLAHNERLSEGPVGGTIQERQAAARRLK